MELTLEEKNDIIRELEIELSAKPDGGRKNLIVPRCFWCGKEGGKLGIYIGRETPSKKLFMAHCFSCGRTSRTLDQLLDILGRPDLKPVAKADFTPIDLDKLFGDMEGQEIDDDLAIVEMPEGWKRCYKNPYLKSRGFTFDDYDMFPVGTTRGLNWKFDDYVVFPIVDNGDYVGYVSRHIWSKKDIDDYNTTAKRNGKFQIRRYNNSVENDFVKLLYNYDSIVEEETDTVIIVEGIFDAIALTRKLNLYDNHRIAVVATFGKKISDAQIFKLQAKGITDVILGYDADATEAINKAAEKLDEYFDVAIARIDPENGKDWDEMDFWDIYDVFAYDLCTPVEFKLNTIYG